MKSFISKPQSECVKLLSGLIDCWIGFAVNTFTKSAAGISGEELLFQEKNRKMRFGFVVKWTSNYDMAVLNLKKNMSETTFA